MNDPFPGYAESKILRNQFVDMPFGGKTQLKIKYKIKGCLWTPFVTEQVKIMLSRNGVQRFLMNPGLDIAGRTSSSLFAPAGPLLSPPDLYNHGVRPP